MDAKLKRKQVGEERLEKRTKTFTVNHKKVKKEEEHSSSSR